MPWFLTKQNSLTYYGRKKKEKQDAIIMFGQ